MTDTRVRRADSTLLDFFAVTDERRRAAIRRAWDRMAARQRRRDELQYFDLGGES